MEKLKELEWFELDLIHVPFILSKKKLFTQHVVMEIINADFFNVKLEEQEQKIDIDLMPRNQLFYDWNYSAFFMKRHSSVLQVGEQDPINNTLIRDKELFLKLRNKLLKQSLKNLRSSKLGSTN